MKFYYMALLQSKISGQTVKKKTFRKMILNFRNKSDEKLTYFRIFFFFFSMIIQRNFTRKLTKSLIIHFMTPRKDIVH